MTYPDVQDVNMSKGFGDLFIYINTVTNQVFSIMLMFAIWIIVFLGFYKASGNTSGAVGIAGFATFAIGLLFWAGGLITGIVFGIVVAVAIAGIGFLLLTRD